MSYQTRIYNQYPPLGTSLFFKRIEPIDESFLQMIRCTLVPYLLGYTFSFFWVLVVIFAFLYGLYLGEVQNSDYFMQVSQNALFQLGENYPYYIVKQFHYYRLFTSLVLVDDFYHCALATFAIAILASYVEEVLGFKRTFVLVLLAGVGGELARNLFQYSATIETLTPICALIGYLIGYYFKHSQAAWLYMRTQKKQMLFILASFSSLFTHTALTRIRYSKFSMAFGLLYGFILFFCDPTHNISVYTVPAIVFVVGSIALLIIGVLFWTNPLLVER